MIAIEKEKKKKRVMNTITIQYIGYANTKFRDKSDGRMIKMNIVLI